MLVQKSRFDPLPVSVSMRLFPKVLKNNPRKKDPRRVALKKGFMTMALKSSSAGKLLSIPAALWFALGQSSANVTEAEACAEQHAEDPDARLDRLLAGDSAQHHCRLGMGLCVEAAVGLHERGRGSPDHVGTDAQ